ncbi:hypothetical protein HNQ51_000417 [Inhella inkyongensis]|uniref:Lipoprotein n=1 Tax=Inhella inkyongensis TaxID=392593 RepID=A0A840S2Q5_9BURK|nr:hypothetical protein [Inhella inkyongensis]MBB5203124.1 hypothetical protein [Inhella inkyongensis]
MKSMQKLPYTGWSLLIALGLSACGGGGDGSSNAPAPSATRLSASNYEDVSRAAAMAYQLSLSTNSITGGGLQMATAQAAVEPLRKALRVQARASNTQVLPCSGGGRMVVTFNDANNNGLSDAGDSAVVEAQACKEDGTTTNGRVQVSMGSTSGSPSFGNYSASFEASYSDFTVQEANGDRVRIHGRMLLSLNQSGSTANWSMQAQNWELSASYQGKTQSLLLNTRTEAQKVSNELRVVLGGNLSSSLVQGQTLTLSTPQTLLTVGTDDYPRSGQIVVRGSAGGTLRLSAISNTQVRLELDANDDGQFEINQVKNWSELD